MKKFILCGQRRSGADAGRGGVGGEAPRFELAGNCAAVLCPVLSELVRRDFAPQRYEDSA